MGMFNMSAGWVKWLPPPPDQHNGVLLGYRIQIKAKNSSKTLAELKLNATSVVLHNLTVGVTYNVRVVAYNRIGEGPYSQPVALVMDAAHVVSPPQAHPSGTAAASNKNKSLLQQTWFLVVLSVLLILILAFVVSGAWYFRKKQLMTKELGHLTGKWGRGCGRRRRVLY